MRRQIFNSGQWVAQALYASASGCRRPKPSGDGGNVTKKLTRNGCFENFCHRGNKVKSNLIHGLDLGKWSNGEPAPKVGESFFVRES